MKNKYSREVYSFVLNHASGKTTEELLKIVNTRFGNIFTLSNLRTFKKNNKIRSGVDTQFKAGHIPVNKCKKLSPETYEKIKSTMFKKGHTPDNHKQVGSERINIDGYTLIKVKEPNVWAYRHIHVWEQVHGKVPDDSIIIFLDGNKRNFDIDNLACITKAENLRLNKSDLRSEFPEITQAGINVVKLEIKIKDKREEG